MALTPDAITAFVQLACLLEAGAPKPGNVSPGRQFGDTRYEDFVASAIAIGPVLGGAASRPLGATIRLAIEATARWTRANTNLGIVLLLTPLARAAASGLPLREAVQRELDATTVADAREVFAAIRLARPGGLGRVETQDVWEDPTVSLLETMRMAAERDGVAREYATSFHTTFVVRAPALRAARRDGLGWNDAIVETFLTLLAHASDTHIARRTGAAAAATVTGRAVTVVGAGGVRTAAGRRALAEMDAALRDPHNALNPGTTADLTAAAILVTLLEGGWPGTPGDEP